MEFEKINSLLQRLRDTSPVSGLFSSPVPCHNFPLNYLDHRTAGRGIRPSLYISRESEVSAYSKHDPSGNPHPKQLVTATWEQGM